MKTLTITITFLLMAAEIPFVYFLNNKLNLREKRVSEANLESNFEATEKEYRNINLKNGNVTFLANSKKLMVDHIKLGNLKTLQNDKIYIADVNITLNKLASEATIQFLKPLPKNDKRLSLMSSHLNILSQNCILLDEFIAKEIGSSAIQILPGTYSIVKKERRFFTVTAKYSHSKKSRS